VRPFAVMDHKRKVRVQDENEITQFLHAADPGIDSVRGQMEMRLNIGNGIPAIKRFRGQ
jgi:hypothetical protein